MKKQSRLHLREMLALLFTILTTIIILFWIYITSNIPNAGFNNETLTQLDGPFTVTLRSASGEHTIETMLPSQLGTANAGDTITVTTTLHADEIDGNCLLFYQQQSWVDVYLDDEALLKAEHNPDLPFPMAAGSRWYFLRLPKDFDGKELRIETTAQFDSYASLLPDIYTGTKSSILYMILHNARYSLFTGIPTLTLGFTCILLGLLLRKKNITDRITLLGLLSVTLSIWYMLESQMTQVFFSNLPLFAFVLFTCFNLIPVLVSALLLTFDTFRQQKYMQVLFVLSCISFFMVQLLQITGIAFYIQMITTVHILIILIILGILLSYLKERQKQKTVKDLYIYKALLLLSSFAILDMIAFYLFPEEQTGAFTKIGLLVFICYLAYTGMKQFYEMEMEAAKAEIYHELAVQDLMTGLSNRTAFEQEMVLLHETPVQPNTMYFFFADVNNLKTINDTYGHAQGDDCIIKTAHNLTQCFFEPNICYRIGGDEFCVICRGLTAKDVEERKTQLYSLVQKQNEETIYPYSIACGYHVIDEDGADACLKKADTIMYREKARIKSQNV